MLLRGDKLREEGAGTTAADEAGGSAGGAAEPQLLRPGTPARRRRVGSSLATHAFRGANLRWGEGADRDDGADRARVGAGWLRTLLRGDKLRGEVRSPRRLRRQEDLRAAQPSRSCSRPGTPAWRRGG